ncbi:MAG TPA: peptide chain release factor N(5)-glutamine methyltransferase, partial [Phytomonospora sp.]
MARTWRDRIVEAAGRLSAAGVPSPLVDAELMAAHIAGTSRGGLILAEPPDEEAAARFAQLVGQRSERVPLQYLIGVDFVGVELAVGPGVFVPRP